MPQVLIKEIDGPAERRAEFPRVPVVGEEIEAFPDGEHTVFEVRRVIFKEGDGNFNAVVHVRRAHDGDSA